MSALLGRDLLSAADLTAEEIGRLFARAERLKAEFRATRRHREQPLAGRTLATFQALAEAVEATESARPVATNRSP